MPYDDTLLEYVCTQWQFGYWESPCFLTPGEVIAQSIKKLNSSVALQK